MDRKRRQTRPPAPAAALGYARVSTTEQAQEGVSLEVQVERIRAYAVAKGLGLVDVLADEGVSGKDLRRPALEELLARCGRGEVAHVVVLKLDRLTRRTRDLLTLVETVFLAKRIELHSVSESLDTSTPHGRFTLTLLGSLAQLERELIAERTRSALAFKRENGQPTSHPPLGFRLNGSKRHRMIPVPEELAVVQRILDLHQRGQGYHAIAATLNLDGVPSKRGGRWHAYTVQKVVDRRAWYAKPLSAP
jgi:site-specific DNA recombinase